MISNNEIQTWRNNWKTKKERSLSINDFDNIDKIIQEAIKRSYAPSVQNTALKNEKYGSEKLKKPRQECEPILLNALIKVYSNITITEQQFIDWEKNLADELKKTYYKNDITKYTYGNAQKWINMSIKYLFSSDHIDHSHKLFEICFLPIDRIVQDKAYKELGVKKLPVAWSRCDTWQNILDYEKNIKNAIKEKTDFNTRLWWECNAWNTSIKQSIN